jgi:hypothetical protein
MRVFAPLLLTANALSPTIAPTLAKPAASPVLSPTLAKPAATPTGTLTVKPTSKPTVTVGGNKPVSVATKTPTVGTNTTKAPVPTTGSNPPKPVANNRPTQMPNMGPTPTRDDTACLRSIRRQCSCGLYLRGEENCVKHNFVNRCTMPDEKKIKAAYDKFCKANCRIYSRFFFLQSSKPTFICNEGT